ncbi:MAG: TIGR03936 family radical SAM-associated protein, partial [Sporichthyaceae bacterium]
MARSPEGPPPPPTVQKLRIRYAKRGRLRFTSHRDFARAFERALRRAQVPMAYSAGFTPHPKVSYANACSTGVASEAEYLEIGLAEVRDPLDIARALDNALPEGLDIVEVVTAGPGALADRLQVSDWRIELAGVESAAVALAIAAFLAADTVEVERMTKNGNRRFDARSAVLAAWVEATLQGPGTGGLATGEIAESAGCSGGRRGGAPPLWGGWAEF